MDLPIADRWFERHQIDDQITLLLEPHVAPLMRCNIWHVRGSARDLIVDTGMGVASLVEELQDVLDKPVTAVATHSHGDHVGGHHEFDDVLVHPAEADNMGRPALTTLDPIEAWGMEAIDGLRKAGYEWDDPQFVTALPAGVAFESFTQRASRVTRLIDESDVVDIGNRQFEVLHLPGHSPGSIGLWEAETGTLVLGRRDLRRPASRRTRSVRHPHLLRHDEAAAGTAGHGCARRTRPQFRSGTPASNRR